jgi:hypothetical protein
MASSHKIVFVLLLLIASSSMLVQARMAPSDRRRARADQAHVKESVPSPSEDVTRDVAPPMPPAPPATASKTEVAVTKRWGTTQADGSVPSPGVGHQQMLQ